MERKKKEAPKTKTYRKLTPGTLYPTPLDTTKRARKGDLIELTDEEFEKFQDQFEEVSTKDLNQLKHNPDVNATKTQELGKESAVKYNVLAIDGGNTYNVVEEGSDEPLNEDGPLTFDEANAMKDALAAEAVAEAVKKEAGVKPSPDEKKAQSKKK